MVQYLKRPNLLERCVVVGNGGLIGWEEAVAEAGGVAHVGAELRGQRSWELEGAQRAPHIHRLVNNNKHILLASKQYNKHISSTSKQ